MDGRAARRTRTRFTISTLRRDHRAADVRDAHERSEGIRAAIRRDDAQWLHQPAATLLKKFFDIDLSDPRLLTDVVKLLDERVDALRSD